MFWLTFPGSTVPTDGETVIGAPSGTTNSNEVGPTGAISPETNFTTQNKPVQY